LIHNASTYGPTPLGRITLDDVQRHLRVNALSPLLLTQAAAEPLRQSRLEGGGSVVFFSDIHVLGRPRRDYLAYTMSKSALTGVIQSLARELAPRIRVNAIAPGVIAWPEGTSRSEIDAYEKRIPLGRSGTPEDAARLVRWLVLEAGYVTGEIIRLDGGRWLT
jgi:pteridine reductase